MTAAALIPTCLSVATEMPWRPSPFILGPPIAKVKAMLWNINSLVAKAKVMPPHVARRDLDSIDAEDSLPHESEAEAIITHESESKATLPQGLVAGSSG